MYTFSVNELQDGKRGKNNHLVVFTKESNEEEKPKLDSQNPL